MSAPNIFIYIKHSQNRQAKLLSSAILAQMETYVDENNSTVLHVAANNNNYEMAEYFLKQHEKLTNQPHPQFTEESKLKWLSVKDNEGFTCLHYAVFRGNYKLAKLFEQNGSDIYQINNQGLSVLHIAAQGDSPLLLYYFLTKGLKIGVTDSKGNTPLHWACYSGMENSSFALISWGAQIDRKQQHFGMTPLHLAVMSGNSRIVRKLLLKGCDRNIRSFNDRLPLDIARQNQYTNIAEMIVDEQQGINEILNLKTPSRKLSRFNTPFFLFNFLFFSTFVMNIVSFALCKNELMHKSFYGTFIGFGTIVAMLFIGTVLSNAGRLRQFDRHRGMMQMLIKNKPNRICFDCGIVKPQRSRHCQICQSCISVYDHHCPWIANCVGAFNYWIFYAFIVVTFVYLLYTFGFSIANLVHENWGNLTSTDILRIVTSVYSLIAASLFAVPLFLLIIVQSRNMLQNVTTFQRYTSTTSYQNMRRQSTSSSSRKSSRNITQMSESLKSDLAQHPSLSISGSRSSGMRPTSSITSGNVRNCQNMCWGNRDVLKYKMAI